MTDITANVIVSMPSQLFTMARSFKAVANGKIYIGKIDTDPVNPENQIQVYIENEDGSHVPVSQPIIINAAGYPVYNGQIAKFVTVQGHSMAVYDAYGAQQFYFPNVLKYNPDQLRTILEGSIIDSSGDVFGSPVRDFEYFGAVGDGVADDTNAIKSAAAWVTSGNYRQITTREQKIYRVTSTVDFNFANGRGHSILMKSPIRPDAGTGTAFLIQNTRDSVFNLKVDGGGDSNADYYVPGSTNFVDYSQADPAGAQTAFYIRGVRNSDIDVTGLKFAGRVLRTNALDVAAGGIIKTSFNTLRIKTGDQGAGETVRCGQAYYLQGDDSAWGKIDRAWLNWDRFGSVHYKLVDVTIGNIEAGFAGNGGLQFYGIATAHIGTLSVGDETLTNTNILFANSTDGQECIAVHIDRIFTGSGNIGVELRGSNGGGGGNRPNFDINSIYVITCANSNVILNGTNNSIIRNIQSQGGAVAVRLQRVIRNLHLTINSSSESGSSILADPGSNINNLYVNGRSYGNTGAATVDLLAATGGMRCVFDGYTVRSGMAAYAIPVTNSVTIQNGEIDISSGGVAFSVGVPRVNVNNVGFITRNRGSGLILAGNQTITISHGLAQQPTEICVTPLSTATGFRVLNITATSFDVRLSSALGGSDPA
ncbi:phage tailspike protein [Escherichia coli]